MLPFGCESAPHSTTIKRLPAFFIPFGPLGGVSNCISLNDFFGRSMTNTLLISVAESSRRRLSYRAKPFRKTLPVEAMSSANTCLPSRTR